VCGRTFPRWYASDYTWKKGGFGKWAAVCKPCFEIRVPKPRYMPIEKYFSMQYDNRKYIDNISLPKDEWVKKMVDKSKVNWESEPGPVPPKLSIEELEEKLLRGECGQAYAKTVEDVKQICLFCNAKDCPGPFNFRNWESKYPKDILSSVPPKSDHLCLRRFSP
jgi:hypothetical protein